MKTGRSAIYVILFNALLLCACAPGAVRDNPSIADAERSPRESPGAGRYWVLREQLENGNWQIDFRELRDAYTQTKQYQPYGGPVSSAMRDIVRHWEEKDFDACLQRVARIESFGFPLLDVHHFGWICADAANDPVTAAHHERVARRILAAIINGKDGMSAENAWSVLTTDEIHLVLAIQGLQPVSQSLVKNGERIFDVMTVVPMNEDGAAQQQRYFDITRQFPHMGAMFSDRR